VAFDRFEGVDGALASTSTVVEAGVIVTISSRIDGPARVSVPHTLQAGHSLQLAKATDDLAPVSESRVSADRRSDLKTFP